MDENLAIEKKQPEDLVRDLEAELSKSRTFWTNVVKELTKKIQEELKTCLSLESESISRRQEINEDIARWSYKIYVDSSKLKILKKQRFEFYSNQYQIKTNSSEKTKLTEADLSWIEAKISCLENYVSFLMETRKTIDHIIWSVKNKIELYNITGMEG